MCQKQITRCMTLLVALALTGIMYISGAGAEQTSTRTVTVYFPNWNVYSDSRDQVKNLPWDRVDCINHAFWKVVRSEGGFAVASTDPWADTDTSNPAAHFPQYAQYSELYPDTDVLLSIGGWTCSGLFSEMALSADSRASFIDSCIETLECYPFLSGLDIDWEYPGIARAGGEGDEGNPVKGDDKANYTLLLKELRQALDAHFGAGCKQLTVCAGGTVSTLAHQDYAALYPYVDRINLMTYDLTGSWNSFTGHHTALYGSASADTAVRSLMSLGVPAEKITIGSPLYSHGWKMYRLYDNVINAAAKALPGGDLTWRELHPLELAAAAKDAQGWHLGYDEDAQAAYLWNDDADSPDYLYFYTYENSRSLEAKLRYIKETGLGGLIVWQINGDDPDSGWPMITQMHVAVQ